MNKIYIQLFIVFVGIILCIIGFLGVKKYFYKNYFDKADYTLVYSSINNTDYIPNIIAPETPTEYIINEEITTQPIITTTTQTTTINTTTTIKAEYNESPLLDEIKTSQIKDDGTIIYDGLTLTGLTEKLNRNLTSTLTNSGFYFANYYKEKGLDPYLAVSIVLLETGCKWSCSSLVKECNNIGGMKGSPSCKGGYMKYDTLDEGIKGYLDMLYNNYYSKGLTTPELINPKYASSTEWSAKVNNYINSIKAS